MGLYFHQQMHWLLAVAIELGRRIRIEATTLGASYYGGVIRVSGENILTIDLVGVTNHAKQTVLLVFTIEGPAGIEYFVTAVL